LRRGKAWTVNKAVIPAKLAAAIVELAGGQDVPARFAAGADAVDVFENKAHTLLTRADAHRQLSGSLSHHDS
jgi:hypothetical protein